MKPGSAPAHSDDGASILERLEAAARAAHDHKVAYEAEMQLRNQLIVKAYDVPLPGHKIANAASLSTTRCLRIVAGSDDEEESAGPVTS